MDKLSYLTTTRGNTGTMTIHGVSNTVSEKGIILKNKDVIENLNFKLRLLITIFKFQS